MAETSSTFARDPRTRERAAIVVGCALVDRIASAGSREAAGDAAASLVAALKAALR